VGANEEAQRAIVEQEKFYYDQFFHLVLAILLVLGLGAGILGIIYLFNSTANPPPVYFMATGQNSLIEETPLDHSNMETNALLNWVTEGMMLSNTFNFMNYQTVMDNAKDYFTKEGLDSYNNALSNNKITDRVIQKKLVLHAVPTDAPQILLEKPFAGRYMWKIKLPMKFSYQSVTTDIQDLMDVTLIVMRVPITESPNGVLILKLDLVLNTAL